MKEMKTVKISEKLFENIEMRIKNPQTGFSTVDEYVEYVLTELFNEDSDEINNDEEAEIKEELKKLVKIETEKELNKLGYIYFNKLKKKTF